MKKITMKNSLVLASALFVVLVWGRGEAQAQCPPCGGVPQTLTTDNWTMQFVRPCLTQATTAGGRGGGIELRNVRYRSSTDQPYRTLIFKAQTPILNATYYLNRCGPFRLWSYQESPYICKGTLTAPGRCDGTATTNCNDPIGGDVGTFCGVTVDTTSNPGWVILISLVRSAWFRYQIEWWFGPDGTILPRILYTAVNHPCLQNDSLDMVYWRIDWDIETSIPNQIEELKVPAAPTYFYTWDQMFIEMSRMRDQSAESSSRQWRVRNTNTQRAYLIIPPEQSGGWYDGISVIPQVSDFWALRYNTALQEETDDCAPPAGGVAFCSLGGSAGYWPHLDRFIDQTSDSTFLLARDVVTWYSAAHFRPASKFGTPHPDDCDYSRVNGPVLMPDPAGAAW